jgi:thiosulfate/3-mercaptopyruvate sulfurtransferase
VWMLRVTGREAALLDGGIGAWDGPLETEPAQRPPAAFSVRPWPEWALADADDAADPANAVIDARPHERFLGERPDPVDPRPGHVPGARSLPAREQVGPDGRLLDREELRRRFAAAGVDGSKPIVSYCGSGVTACHNLVLLEHLGLGGGRLYAGSWSQWSHSSRPAETGGS